MAQPLILFDLGDTIMIEESEQKDSGGVTQVAELIPGIAALLQDLVTTGYHLALVADTRIGTYQNVLRQHNLYTHFTHFAISDELGIEKPHPEMFLSVVQRAGSIPAATLMVGNNYRADIEGAHACGLTTVWFRWNERYPAPHVPVAANYVATTVDELRTAIADWQGSPLFRR